MATANDGPIDPTWVPGFKWDHNQGTHQDRLSASVVVPWLHRNTELWSSLVIDELNAALTALKSELTTEFVARIDTATDALKRTVQSTYAQHMDIRPSTHVPSTNFSLKPATHTPATESTNPAKRRLVDRSPPVVNMASSLLTGIAPIKTPSHAALLLPHEVPRFWLYLSRCQPTASVQDVAAFVKDQIGTNDVIVNKLVSASRDPGTLTFSSFKVGLLLELCERALSRSTWPVGVVFTLRAHTAYRWVAYLA